MPIQSKLISACVKVRGVDTHLMGAQSQLGAGVRGATFDHSPWALCDLVPGACVVRIVWPQTSVRKHPAAMHVGRSRWGGALPQGYSTGQPGARQRGSFSYFATISLYIMVRPRGTEQKSFALSSRALRPAVQITHLRRQRALLHMSFGIWRLLPPVLDSPLYDTHTNPASCRQPCKLVLCLAHALVSHSTRRMTSRGLLHCYCTAPMTEVGLLPAFTKHVDAAHAGLHACQFTAQAGAVNALP